MTDHAWPTPLKPCAYRGVIGEIVEAIAPQTEADPAAILVQMLTMFGNCIGRSPFFRVGADVHHLNLFAAIVGSTANSRKGMSKGEAQGIFKDLDEDWAKDCIAGGLSSGEGLIWRVRDPITGEHPAPREKGKPLKYETVVEDSGVRDKRLLVMETEFVKTLKVMARDGNTLSSVIRQAWDGEDLSTLTKNSTARATAPHISIVVHITPDELHRYFEATDAANGFGNRFLWVLAKRTKELPFGGTAVRRDDLGRRLLRAVDDARRSSELKFDGAAYDAWARIYSPLSAGRPGMLGAITARAAPQVRRLAGLYALADATNVIGLAHLDAALELWRYSFESARVLFGNRLGDPVADAILAHLRRLYPESVTRTEIRDLFHRHKPASEIDRALAQLQDYKLAKVEKDRGGSDGGRPTERWYLGGDIYDISDITPPGTEDRSLKSLISHRQDSHEHGSKPNRKGAPHEQL